jgi:hypothetical protein
MPPDHAAIKSNLTTSPLFWHNSRLDRANMLLDRREIEAILADNPYEILEKCGFSKEISEQTRCLIDRHGLLVGLSRALAAYAVDDPEYLLEDEQNLRRRPDAGLGSAHAQATYFDPLASDRFHLEITKESIQEAFGSEKFELELFPSTIVVKNTARYSNPKGDYSLEIILPDFTSSRTDTLNVLALNMQFTNKRLGFLALDIFPEGICVRSYNPSTYLAFNYQERQHYKDWIGIALIGLERWALDLHSRGLFNNLFENSLKCEPRIFIPVEREDIFQRLDRADYSEVVANAIKLRERLPLSTQTSDPNLSEQTKARIDSVRYENNTALDYSVHKLGYRKVPFSSFSKREIILEEKDYWVKDISTDAAWSSSSIKGSTRFNPSLVAQVREMLFRERNKNTFNTLPSQIDPSSPLGRSFVFFNRTIDAQINTIRENVRKVYPQRFYPHCSPMGVPGSYSTNRGFVLDGASLQAELSKSMQLTAISRVETPSIQGMSQARCELHYRLLNNPSLKPVLNALSAEHSPVSKGPFGAIHQNWWEIKELGQAKWAVDAIHLPDQNRNPSVRLITQNSSSAPEIAQCICFKGGGAYSLEGDVVEVPPFVQAKKAWLPFYCRIPDYDDGVLLLASLNYWGGDFVIHAENELANLMGVHQLADHIEPELSRVLPTPLDACVYEEIPYWTEDGQCRYLPWDDYVYDILGFKEEPFTLRPGVLRVAAKCDVRLRQLVAQVFCTEFTEPVKHSTIQNSIDNALRFFYKTNGEEFILPEQELITKNGVITVAEIAQYLIACGEKNYSAANRIFNRLNSDLIKITAAMHGAGSHLGGSMMKDGKSGARGAGSLSLRNISLAGELFDMDMGLHLPWLKIPAQSETAAVFNYELIRMRQRDLLMLNECLYWYKVMLFGEQVTHGTTLQKHDFDDLSSLFRFGDDGKDLISRLFVLDDEEKLLGPERPTSNLDFLSTTRDKELYLEYFDKGAQARGKLI